ncbi:hypothetical protein [Scytonema sp. NUACC26]|uniref:hypothetical protein n=1 Tax=Scytonema sp. NUACC26 TaxID=3140176 RepID=UPI0034DBB46A
MTSRLTETQNLIADIDRLLTHKRLSRFLSSQASEPRQILEQTRNFLVRLAESDEQERSQQIQQSALLARFAGQEETSQTSPVEQNELQQHASADTSTIKGEFSAFLAPLQAELQTLLHERANLVEEIRQLEQRRLHNYSLAQQLANQEQTIAEFLQVLKNRLVTSSTSPEGETNSQELQIPSTDNASATINQRSYVQPVTTSTQAPSLHSADRVEEVARLARELDRQLLALDGTVNVVFDSLQRNIHTYHESLSQALSRMHSKGVQGEQLLTGLIGNLTQHFQQYSLESEPHKNDVKEETLKPSLSQPLSPELLEPKPIDNSSSPTETAFAFGVSRTRLIATQVDFKVYENTAPRENVSVVPSPLEGDTQTTLVTNTTPDSVAPDSSQIETDEVDRLYASLFENEAENQETNTATDEVTDVTDKNASEETEDLTADAPVTPVIAQVQPEVLPPPASVEVKEVKKATNFIDDLFLGISSSPSTKTSPKINPVPKVVPPEVTPPIIQSTHFIDELFMDLTLSSSIQTPPPSINPVLKEDREAIPEVQESTSIIDDLFAETPPSTTEEEQLDSETFLHEVVFEAPSATTDLVQAEVTNLQEEPITEDTTLPAQPTDREVPTDSVASIPDPWVEGSEKKLLNRDLTDTQERQEVPVESTVVDELESDDATLMVDEPLSADIITALTDLLNDTNDDELILEESSFGREANTGIATTQAEPSVVIVDNRDADSLQESYVPASPQENLLPQEDNQSLEVADISLEEAQLQQLEQDLASFDGELNSLLQPLNDLENRENTQSRIIPQEIPQPAGTEPSSDAEKELVAATEKKTEATEEQLVGSLVSISRSTDDKEVTLEAANSVWYLGIDLGTTGISAALLNRSTTEVYPLYWMAENQPEANARSFRLPAEVYLPTASVNVSETESSHSHEQKPPVAEGEGGNQAAATQSHNLFSAQLKPYLQIALPYKNEQQKWEPVLQLNDFSTVPLVWVVRSLSKLLLTLMADRSSTTLGLTAAAVGIEQDIFRTIISRVTGIICNCPSNWSEQYRFNVREAILTSKLVRHSQQVFFVEEAIACLLSELDGASGEIVKIKGRQGNRLAKTSDRPLNGSTLVISIGADATEMALVDLPENLEDLTHNDFMLHSFTYAGKGLEQDIVSQLLLPSKWRQPRTENQSDSKTISSNPWHWQPSVPGLDQMNFSSLGLEELTLPRPGEPDLVERVRLQQRLESSLLGKAVVDAAVALKLILQHQESFTLELADQKWLLQRRDLESQVFVPFVRRINRELNRLLVAKGLPTEAINQAILTGGVASLGAVSRWLRQKLPNARIIQDLYLGENGSPTCSRVAYGLAVLPLHPQVLEVSRQQYTDYFLFTELLRILPTRPVSFGEIIQLFENRGINTRNCQQRLLAFLEGELPPGLVPTSTEATWLVPASSENPDYQALSAAPLFEKQGSLTYRPNAQQLQAIARYLDAIKASTRQSLDEPYTVNFAVGVLQ